jgi:hypothetical protein
MNPPICAVPSRDKLWMCPNHIEHYLEQYLLSSSSRLSERIKMWKKYSISDSSEFSGIIKTFLGILFRVSYRVYSLKKTRFSTFIEKCRSGSNDSRTLSNTKSSRSIHRCSVPSPVRNMYASKKLVNDSDEIVDCQENFEADSSDGENDLKEPADSVIKI